MSMLRLGRAWMTPFLFAWAIAFAASAASAQPCAGGGADGCPPWGAGGEILPSAVMYESGPCRFTPHDVDPCYNFRCYLYPDSPAPPLYVQAELVPFFRDSARSVTYATRGPEGAVVLTSDSIDSEFQGGLRFLVGGNINDYYRLESSFTGFHNWADSYTVRDFSLNALTPATQGNLFSPFSGFGSALGNVDGGVPGVVGVDFNNSATFALTSSYDSVESNILFDIPRWRNVESSASIGVRYNKIDETAGYATASFEPTAAGGSAVAIENAITNDMIGLQLGARFRFLVQPRAWLDFDLRGAIYHNDIESSLVYAQTQGGATVATFAAATDVEKTTFGGDLSLILNYLVTPNFSLRLGYQALWLDSVALAAENIIPDGIRISRGVGGAPNTLVFAPLEIDHSGEVVYHGPVAGVVWLW